MSGQLRALFLSPDGHRRLFGNDIIQPPPPPPLRPPRPSISGLLKYAAALH